MGGRISISDRKGFTLLELLVSLFILMVGLLGLLSAVNMAISTNVQNEMRTQAASIAEGYMARKKSLPFDNITTSEEKSLNWREAELPEVKLRNSFLNYSVAYSVEDISDKSKRVNIGIRWHRKGSDYEHVVSTVVLKPDTK